MSSNPESRYIRNIDTESSPPPKINEALAKSAEKVVIDCLNENLQSMNVETRPATPTEDSGITHEGGKQIDAVLVESASKRPIMCMQITTARDPGVQIKKVKQLAEKPFVRLEEMDLANYPTSIPKVVVGINPTEIESFLNDPYFSKHPQIWEKIKNDITKSLLFVLNMTKNEKEKAKAMEVLDLFTNNTITFH
jgi:hypothetical protein